MAEQSEIAELSTEAHRFFAQNFPGASYALAHGSFVFPNGSDLATDRAEDGRGGGRGRAVKIRSAPQLDFVLVVADDKLPGTETLSTPVNPTYGISSSTSTIIDGPTLTTAEWHSGNLRRHPDHYFSNRLRGRTFIEIARIQRESKAPILYFPLVDLPKNVEPANKPAHITNAAKNVKSKYGVVSHADFIRDLTRWAPFHIAGRLQKTFLSFQSGECGAKSAPLHVLDPPPALARAVRVNRLRAVQMALLLLPEEFTFAEFLRTILELSYIGDIRCVLGETASSRATDLLEAQAVPLADTYLRLLLETEGFLMGDFQMLEVKSAPPELCVGGKLNGTAAVTDAARGAVSLRALRRLVNEISLAPPVAVSPVPAAVSGLEKALLSSEFKLRQNMNPSVRQDLFATLPTECRETANELSGRVRVRTLFSPMSLLSAKRFYREPGHPKAFDPAILRATLASMTRKTSTAVAVKAARTVSLNTCVNYVAQKMAKQLLR